MEAVCKGLLLSAQMQLLFPPCMYMQQEFHVHKLTPSPWQATSGL